MPTDQPIQRFKPKDIIEGRILPRTRIRYFDHAGVRELETLDTGVFFILAWWSGPAFIALDHLTKAILSADPAGKIELVIVDTDGIPDLYAYDFLRGKIHGYGECGWKKKEVVVGTLFRLGEIADYEERIIQVLE
jgi:hypothetical protein